MIDEILLYNNNINLINACAHTLLLVPASQLNDMEF